LENMAMNKTITMTTWRLGAEDWEQKTLNSKRRQEQDNRTQPDQ